MLYSNFFNASNPNNWLYRGTSEWTITRTTDNSVKIYGLGSDGAVRYNNDQNPAYAVRPTFYLNKDVTLNKTAHAGSNTVPYRISN